MAQYVLTVVGDTNDADYITSTSDINDDDTIGIEMNMIPMINVFAKPS